MSSLDPVQEELIRSDQIYRSLYEEHREFDQKLQDMSTRSFLTPEDEGEIKRIKLHKLTLKDKMEAISRDHRRAAAS